MKGKEQPERNVFHFPGAMRKTVGLSYGSVAFAPLEKLWRCCYTGNWLFQELFVAIHENSKEQTISSLCPHAKTTGS